MLSENLKTLRKQKGFSQEELAVRVNVVRQTISKWEKGLSVPDADTIVKLAEVLEVSVNEILGEEIKDVTNHSDIASQLTNLNALIAIQIQRKEQFRKKLITTIAIVVLILFIAAIYPSWQEMWHEFGRNLYHLTH